MQTIQKRKQWVVIALTIIATLTLQLFAPITAHAEETSSEERTITYSASLSYTNYYGKETSYKWDNSMTGVGHFHVLPYSYPIEASDGSTITWYGALYVSDSEFTLDEVYYITSYTDDIPTITPHEKSYTSNRKNGISMLDLSFMSVSSDDIISSNFPKIRSFSNYDDCVSWIDSLTADNFDFTKDDYKDPVFDESTATYDVNLDFASLGAKSNTAWTVSKGDDGYTLTTPSNAGVNIYWTNKQYVENSYVKICFNGKYYKKFLDIKYVDGAISLSGEGASSSVEYDKIDRSSNSVFFLYNDILSECIKQNNYDGGYSFVIDNIQLQCYAEIDGIVKKSRIYKIDFNLLRENGTTDTVFNDASNVTYSTTDSVLGDFTTAYDDLEFVADIDADKPIYEYDEVESNSFIKFFKWFYEMLQGITNSLGQFPQLLTSVFGFLPKEVTIIIGLALGAVVILRFLGR